MPEQTTIKSDGTQVTVRTPDVKPDLKKPCQAIVTTQVVICQPMTDGTWQLISAFNDNYNIVLEERSSDKARQEVVSRIAEIKQQWKDQERIISLENLLLTGRPNLLKTEPNESSPVPDVTEN